MFDYNPMNDYLFKYIFGREERKNITINFLNAVLDLDSDKEIKDVEFVDRELDPIMDGGKLSRLDIYAILDNGSRVNIEVQVVNEHDITQRTLYYWARVYSDQMHEGMKYKNMMPCISINVLGFNYLECEKPCTKFFLYDPIDNLTYGKECEVYVLEVKKFKSKNIKEMRRVERWLAYLNRKDNNLIKELSDDDKIIKEALEAERIFMLDDKERIKYNARQDAIIDYYSRMGSSYDRGLEDGELKTHIAIIRNSIKNNLDIELIASITSLSKKEVLQIIADYKIK